ncbi:MAG: phosphotransferase [Devosia sp.]
MSVPHEALRNRIEAILGFQVVEWTLVHRGYTATRRYVARSGSQSAFIKIGTSAITAGMVNREIAIYRSLTAPFMPSLVGASTDPIEPVLVIENLSSAAWPPPWPTPRLSVVLEQIKEMHRTVSDLEAKTLLNDQRKAGWLTVAREPAPFLSLGLASREWLEKSLPTLIDAEQRCQLHGNSLTHLDLRSDNICIHEGQVKFVDWAEAGTGNAAVDLGFFLPSLAFEGGPSPDKIMPSAPEVAALISGFFAARAGLPTIPDAPFVRRVQLEQLSTALPWAQRALELPSPRGVTLGPGTSAIPKPFG